MTSGMRRWAALRCFVPRICWRTTVCRCAVQSFAVVANSFHVRPLLHFLESNRYFYVLTLSQNRVSLYEGSPYSLCQVDVPELPKSLDETFGKDQREAVINAYDARPGQSGAIYYGYGVPPEEQVKEKLAAFFRVVDLALWDNLLRDERVPRSSPGSDTITRSTVRSVGTVI